MTLGIARKVRSKKYSTTTFNGREITVQKGSKKDSEKHGKD
jgi:hypothetical protein